MVMNSGEHEDTEEHDKGCGVNEIKLVCEQMKKNITEPKCKNN